MQALEIYVISQCVNVWAHKTEEKTQRMKKEKKKKKEIKKERRRIDDRVVSDTTFIPGD
jgi:elongation factor P--beta-lysine ligase